MKQKNNIYYDVNKILSYDALFNFVIGARGVGKTYGFKMLAMKRFLKTGEEFFLLRRTDVELKDALESFWDDIEDNFPTYTCRVRSNKIEIAPYEVDDEGNVKITAAWRVCGHGGYLSNARRKKSVSYSKVWIILFDEFLVDEQGLGRYVGNEVETFLNMYETIARTRDVRVLFTANAMSTVNPYFIYFKLEVPRTRTGIKRIRDDIMVEVVKNDAYVDYKKKTRFGKLVEDTDFAKSAIDNEFITETDDMIKKKDSTAFYEFTLIYDGVWFAVYRSNKLQEIYVSQDVNYQCPKVFEYKSGRKTSMIFKNRTRYVIINDFVCNFECGNVYFENQFIKHHMMEFMRKIM